MELSNLKLWFYGGHQLPTLAGTCLDNLWCWFKRVRPKRISGTGKTAFDFMCNDIAG